MRLGTAYQRDNGYYVHSNSQTTCGVWIATHPFLKLPPDALPYDLGVAVQDAVKASTVGIAHPENWHLVADPLPELAGVRSWTTFMKSARCVSIEASGGSIELRPNKNCGP